MIEMETFKRIKNVLVKCFVISFLILVVLSAFCHFNPGLLFNMCAGFHNVSVDKATASVLSMFNLMSAITFFIFLIPAIAINWERACFAKKAKKEVEQEMGL